MGNDTNFNNYFGRIYQARYLTGVAAGLKSLEMGNNSIGYVARPTTGSMPRPAPASTPSPWACRPSTPTPWSM